MILRELNGDLYYGEPRGIVTSASGEREGINTMRYRESEIERIAHVAFRTARQRKRKLCSVDKANVLETMLLWREVVTRVGKDYPDIELTHLFVDAAAMQLLRAPTQFDVMVMGNVFGDILSDSAAMLTGSIGMLPSASLGSGSKGLVRARARLGSRHRRQGRRQPARSDPVGSDDAAPFVRSAEAGGAHPRGGARGACRRLQDGGYLSAGCAPCRYTRDGRRCR